jgi:DNA-binding Lrp family transcriptional regulator
MEFQMTEVLRRVMKYLVEGIVVGFAAYLIAGGNKKKLDVEEVLMIGLTAAAVFAVLDMFSPGIAVATRTGAGLGMGANLVGFPM